MGKAMDNQEQSKVTSVNVTIDPVCCIWFVHPLPTVWCSRSKTVPSLSGLTSESWGKIRELVFFNMH